MERGFLVEPDLPREIIDELFDELVIGFVDELFQALDNLFLPLHVGGGEQLVIMQRLEQLVVFDRTLLFDIAEARVTDAVVGHIDPLGSRARNVHEVVRSGAHHCLPGKGYYNLERESEICKLEAASDAQAARCVRTLRLLRPGRTRCTHCTCCTRCTHCTHCTCCTRCTRCTRLRFPSHVTHRLLPQRWARWRGADA